MPFSRGSLPLEFETSSSPRFETLKNTPIGSAVFDTCCAITAAFAPYSDSGAAIALALEDRVSALANLDLRDELDNFLGSKRVRNHAAASGILTAYRKKIRIVPQYAGEEIDPALVGYDCSDIAVLETALTARCKLVLTRDGRHLLGNADRIFEKTGISVIHPSQLFEILAPALLSLGRQ